MMAIFSHDLPSATVSQSRLRIFQATRRPKFIRDETLVTPWGAVRVSGKLGQGHADVLEALLYCAERNSTLEDGRIKVLVDPFQIRKHSNISSTKALAVIMEELMMAVVSVDFKTPKSDLRCKSTGHLIDYFRDAVKKNGEKITKSNPIQKQQRPIWSVELGKALTDIISHDIWHTSDPLPIATLKHGISQALARFIRGHLNEPRGGWSLDNTIKVLTNEYISSQQLRDRRREVRFDEGALLNLGIRIVGDRIFKVKRTSVEQTSDGVEQTSDGVEQTSGSVEQTSGVRRYLRFNSDAVVRAMPPVQPNYIIPAGGR